MSRKVAAALAGLVEVVNALQPARQRGKTVANLMAELERRASRTVETPHGPLTFLTSRGRHVAGAVDNFRGNEPETLEWIDRDIAAGEVLWDIGAAFGQFALYAGKRGARVVAFEPKATSYGLLVEHVALNGLGERVTPLCLALSDKTGPTAIHLHGLDPGGALNTLQGSVNQFGETPSAFLQPVFAARMDDAVSLYALPPPDHVKLDVDGIEPWIVAGGPQAFARCKTVLIEVEGAAVETAGKDVDAPLAAAGLVEDRSMRDRGSGRNRLFRRA